MFKSVVLASVAVASLTAFAAGASAQQITPQLGYGTTANEAFLVQRGTGNNSTIDQTGGTNLKAGSLNNQVDLSATNMYTGYADSQFEAANTMVQRGDYNTLNVTQGNTNNQVITVANNVTRSDFNLGADKGSFQFGTGNTVNANQQGQNGLVQFQQNGGNNNASLTVDNGADRTYAGTFQAGNSNTAAIHQYGNASNAYGVIVQSGNSNKGYIDQYGTTNYAALLQVGDNNTAAIAQAGQAGVGAFGYQNGNGNSGSVTQNGGHFANAGFAQIGNSNGVTIRQR
ncbi:hypothetical protein ACLBXO_09950 [Methylobacterium sp. C33D]